MPSTQRESIRHKAEPFTTGENEMAKKKTGVSPQQKFIDARAAMNKSLIERHDEIDMVLVGVLCHENPLFVGPPGTGKSFLIDSLMKWMSSDTKKFSVLLNKMSVAEEVFGPLDIQQLKAGKYVRVMRGKLPEADFAFLDEVFKASTAILNTMLKILNEGLFDKGDGEVKCPLKIALAASNEWPSGEELGALFDRFLLRKTVGYIRRIGRRRLLRERSHAPTFTSSITPEELDLAHAEAMALELADSAWEALDEIIAELNKAGIIPGDRRMKKAVNVARAFAYLRGASEVEPVHLEVLKWVLWVDATEQEKKCHSIVCKLSNPVGSKITELLMQAASVVETSKPEEAVSKLQDVQRQLKDQPEHERKAAAIGWVTKEIANQYNKVIGFEEALT